MARPDKRPLIKRINRGAILLALLLVIGIVFILVQHRLDSGLPEMAEKAVQEYIAEHPEENIPNRRYNEHKITRNSLTRRTVEMTGVLEKAGMYGNIHYISDYFEYERSGLGWKLVYIRIDDGNYSEAVESEVGY